MGGGIDRVGTGLSVSYGRSFATAGVCFASVIQGSKRLQSSSFGFIFVVSNYF